MNWNLLCWLAAVGELGSVCGGRERHQLLLVGRFLELLQWAVYGLVLVAMMERWQWLEQCGFLLWHFSLQCGGADLDSELHRRM